MKSIVCAIVLLSSLHVFASSNYRCSNESTSFDMQVSEKKDILAIETPAGTVEYKRQGLRTPPPQQPETHKWACTCNDRDRDFDTWGNTEEEARNACTSAGNWVRDCYNLQN